MYFCCLEALQNAGKHAGDGATAKLRVWDEDDVLHFEVSDDGAGFTPSAPTRSGDLGHGFVNMADRLGAIDGSLDVQSGPGHGTTISGAPPRCPSSRAGAPACRAAAGRPGRSGQRFARGGESG